MNIREAIRDRHSVRQYLDRSIEEGTVLKLKEVIDQCNEDSNLSIQLVLDDPGCFDTFLAHYGKFENVNNYIAIVGDKGLSDLDELAGYYGQKIVLEAQMMGLNTCWVGGTFGKGKCKAIINSGEKLVCVISIGYGKNQGKKHKSKPVAKLCGVRQDDMPAWFKNGMIAAMMAPTALNQQRFFVEMDGEAAFITAGRGPFSKVDLGIVKYNFEAASGHKCI